MKHRLIFSFGLITLLLIGAAAVGVARLSTAEAQGDDPTCFMLTLQVVGGKGELPTVTEPNCGEDLYAAGTVVELTAVPDDDYSVYAWYGTDDDSSVALT
ncbi:MAG: hypothetical protein GYB65_03540, partial [Chloroflexi bacterium]|nr:hypothetical protein [Chloroflexota bacterium]